MLIEAPEGYSVEFLWRWLEWAGSGLHIHFYVQPNNSVEGVLCPKGCRVCCCCFKCYFFPFLLILVKLYLVVVNKCQSDAPEGYR